jgi:methionine synthase II (cobalamin-independent)
MKIDKNITIEDLVDDYPFSVNFLSKKGIKCIACGEPIWGTLEEACPEKNFSQEEIRNFVIELNELIK